MGFVLYVKQINLGDWTYTLNKTLALTATVLSFLVIVGCAVQISPPSPISEPSISNSESAAPVPQGGGSATEGLLKQEASVAPAVQAAPSPSRQAVVDALRPREVNTSVQLVPPAAEAYLVMDELSGAVLAEKNSTQRRSPASLVKIMTALIAIERIERGNLDDMVDIDVDFTQLRRSTAMGLLPGERLSLRDLLYGLMLPSGNDAAIAIAKNIAGTEPAFVNMMNRRAKELGMQDSYFANPHGLDFGAYGQGYSTSYDLALLGRQAMSLSTFREIAGTQYWVAQGKNQSYQMSNQNALLYNYEGADGVKIGFTGRAGQTLVGSVTRNGRRVYAVVMGSPHRMTDSVRLYDYVFQKYAW